VGERGGEEGRCSKHVPGELVQRVVQLAHGVLQDALGLGGSAPQHCKLFVQQPLPQPLLLTLLVAGGQAAWSTLLKPRV
jgi:hypothetical protein